MVNLETTNMEGRDKKSVLITGAEGLVGQALVNYFNTNSELAVFGPGHEELDVTNPESIKKALQKIKPAIVINCAVNLNVDFCEANPEKCFSVNRDGVKNLLMFNPPGCTFVQISSSEVFGRVNEGEYKIEGYTEEEEPRPVSIYQKSKAAAEEIVKKYKGKWFIARAGWLFGKGRKTFVDTVYETLQEGKELTVAEDQWRSPTWTRDFAKGLENLLFGNYPSGIYHIVNEVKPGEATPRQIVEEIAKYLKVRPKIRSVSRKDFFKVPRAPSNVLKNTKLPPLPYWREALEEYLKYIS